MFISSLDFFRIKHNCATLGMPQKPPDRQSTESLSLDCSSAIWTGISKIDWDLMLSDCSSIALAWSRSTAYKSILYILANHPSSIRKIQRQILHRILQGEWIHRYPAFPASSPKCNVFCQRKTSDKKVLRVLAPCLP